MKLMTIIDKFNSQKTVQSSYFGIKTEPGAFQQLMDTMLAGLDMVAP